MKLIFMWHKKRKAPSSWPRKATIPVALGCVLISASGARALPEGELFTNSIGMEFVRVEPGEFEMGQVETPLPWKILPHTGGRGNRMDSLRDGDFDEHPVHTVRITKPFYIGVYEVTNLQYEEFDSRHRSLRGRRGFSKGDNEAVVYVNWYDAKGFCQWLSEKEGRAYRLPTEAEWEYACRAGTRSHYYTGATLPKAYHKNQHETKVPEPVNLQVGQTPPNPWGLYEMHGNVEEWCHDWSNIWTP